MPRVLIPTDVDEPDFLPGLIQGYRSLGWDVTTGARNFKICAANYDLIHFQWPEEHSGWQVPSEGNLEEIEKALHWWKWRAKTLISVHNLYPHNGFGHPAYHKLYSAFYKHCDLISHFSHASQRLVLNEFSAARDTRHVVHCPPPCDVALTKQRQRGDRRHEFGIREDEFVILIIGRLRSWSEVRLIQRSYDSAKVRGKRLLMLGKIDISEGRFQRQLHLIKWKAWLKRRRAVIESSYVPDEHISRFVDSSNIILVPRIVALNSAMISLGMTFGRMIIAPRLSSFAEQLKGSRNLLYEAGDAISCARKLEQAASLDTDDIGRENAILASKWNWNEICTKCLVAINEQLQIA